MSKCTLTTSNLAKTIIQASNTCRNLTEIWHKGGFDKQVRLQKLVFPEGITFDKQNGTFRTPDLNEIIADIARLAGNLCKKEKGLNTIKSTKSLFAEKEGFEPSIQFPVCMFSKHVLSASQASLQLFTETTNVIFFLNY